MAETVVAGRYRLAEQIAAGWMSEVWVAPPPPTETIPTEPPSPSDTTTAVGETTP